MKRPVWHDFALAISVFVFVCLLFHGGSRLIATPEKSVTPMISVDSWLSASLTQPSSQQREETALRRADQKRVLDKTLICRCEKTEDAAVPVSDANGNILRCASYLREVYQSFSLGDGFV